MKNNMLKNMLGVGRDIMMGMKKKPEVYSREWAATASDKEFNAAREIIRKAMIAGKPAAYTILHNIDSYRNDAAWEKGYREHPGEEPKFYQKPHGWHLKDDD